MEDHAWMGDLRWDDPDPPWNNVDVDALWRPQIPDLEMAPTRDLTLIAREEAIRRDIRRMQRLELEIDRNHDLTQAAPLLEATTLNRATNSHTFTRLPQTVWPKDGDTGDEIIDLDFDESNVEGVDVESAEDVSDRMNTEGNEDPAGKKTGPKRNVPELVMAVKNKTPDKIRCPGKVRKDFPPKESSRKSTPEKSTSHKTTAGQGDMVAEITQSKVHYAVLKYRVRWRGQSEPEKTRYARTEPMFVDNEYCRALVTQFHRDNPEADNTQTEASSERRAYGSVTKGGKKVSAPDGRNPSLTPSTGSPSSNSSVNQQGEVNNQMCMSSGAVPASAAGIMTPPSSSAASTSPPSSAPQQNESNDDTEMRDSIVVDSAPLSPPGPSRIFGFSVFG